MVWNLFVANVHPLALLFLVSKHYSVGSYIACCDVYVVAVAESTINPNAFDSVAGSQNTILMWSTGGRQGSKGRRCLRRLARSRCQSAMRMIELRRSMAQLVL
jgi:hypothetical protein